MTERFEITREIGIDMGHRVPTHGSKCRNLHGHRYTIQATCSGPLAFAGEQSDMVIDFGFLKDEMMSVIDGPFDHALCLCANDSLALRLCGARVEVMGHWVARLVDGVGRIVLINSIPTAEALAALWFAVLAPRVLSRTGDRARLERLRVYETPNCWADYARPPANAEMFSELERAEAGWRGLA